MPLRATYSEALPTIVALWIRHFPHGVVEDHPARPCCRFCCRLAATVEGYHFQQPLSLQSEANALSYIRAALESALKEVTEE